MAATPSENRVLPDLTTRLAANLTLASPILAAAGTFGYGVEAAELADCRRLGALITPTLTLEARPGNPMPRTAEAHAGLLHALGLPNPGLRAFLTERLPGLRALPCPVIVSIAAETPEAWRDLAAELTRAGGAAALELNLTPFPLLAAEHAALPLPDEAEGLAALTTAITVVRATTSLPLLAKLPPVGVEIGAAAKAAEEAGADAINVSQSFPGIAVRLSSRQFRFPGVVGGLSGPCIKPLALYQVWRAAQSTALPIVGTGGVMTAEDALEFFLTGASVVAVGVANLISPSAVARLTDDLTAYLTAHQLPDLTSFIGAARQAKV